VVIDGTFRDGEREELLEEVEAELPLWLTRSAVPNPEPVGELTELLRFEARDLRRVHAVHVCLSEPIERLVAALPAALRRPVPATDRPRETGAAVRGPIDWLATVQLHAGGQPGVYATRPRRRTFDTPEHRSLRWALQRLGMFTALADLDSDPGADADEADPVESLGARLAAVGRVLRFARRTTWLVDVPAERPTPRTRHRLAGSRSPFIRTVLAPAVERLLRDDTQDPHELARLLRERYFTPARNWRLHEVVVLIRIDRALAGADVHHRRRKLFSASGTVAEYRLPDGDRIHVRQQTWPGRSGATSRRIATGSRHGLDLAPTRPDIVVQRIGDKPDLVVLELKASRSKSTLGEGLSQLLGYLYDRPGLFGLPPAGWLVPLPFSKLTETEPDIDEPLWIVDATKVADAVVKRMVS
jgi:hypothetical protein